MFANETLPLYIGIAVLVIAAILLVYVVVQSTGERPDVERSLHLLTTEIDAWARHKKHIDPEEPLHLQLLHAANPLGRRMILPGSLKEIEMQITYAGNPPVWNVENVLAMKVFSVVAGALIGLVFIADGAANGLLIGLAFAATGYELPDLMLRSIAGKRQTEIQRTLPDTLDLLTVTVEAGLAFDAAVVQVTANTGGALARELQRYLQEKQIGLSSREALESLSRRTSIDELKSFTTALLQADKIGISIGPVLRELTGEMRLKRRQRAQEKAQQVPVKILIPLILFIFPVFMIVVLGPVVLLSMTTGL
jgi:tight adherence protein C